MKKNLICIAVVIVALLALMASLPVFAEGAAADVRLTGGTASIGSELTFTVSVSNAKGIQAIAVVPTCGTGLKLTGGAWLVSGPLVNFDPKLGDGVVAFDSATDLDCDILTFTLEVTDDAVIGSTVNVDCEVTLSDGSTGTPYNCSCNVTIVCEHSFTEKSTDTKYLKSAATCTSKATYLYSCSKCGAVGTSTFEDGDMLPHTYSQRNTAAAYLKSAATCKAKAVYYYSCTCGAKSTETFEDGEVAAHTYDKQSTDATYLKSAATCTAKAVYYYSCTCGDKGTATFMLIATVICASAARSTVRGDMDNDGKVGISDALYLLRHTLMPSRYTIDQSGDLNGDGLVNGDDAIYLLRHTLLPSSYPLVEEHDLTAHAAKAATCTEDGNIAYWTCSECGKYFSDENGRNEIKPSDTVVAAGHAYAKTWSYNDTEHYHSCTRTGCTAKTGSTAHTWGAANTCTVCGHQGEIPETDASLFTFKAVAGGYEVTKYNGSISAVKIPATYDDQPIVSISDSAFYNCSHLTSITIPDSVTSIGGYAFSGCSGLTNITIPDSVTSIGYYAFYGCSSLTSIIIPDNIMSIGESVFRDCSSLTSITIPGSVTSIGYQAFHNCGSLKSITIPDSVTSIDNSAFWGCQSLTSITIPDSVTSIGGGAFNYCYKLIEVCNLSKLDITIGSYSNGMVGYYAKNVYTATTGASKLWTNSDGYIFYEDGDTCYLMGYTGSDTVLTLPANCNEKNYEIYEYAFYNCSNLTSITIPDSVISIGQDVLSGCRSLESITLPFVGDSKMSQMFLGYFFGASFYNNHSNYVPNSLKSVAVTRATSIDDYAFSGCSSLTSITIPNSVTSMGDYAFFNCTSLTNITIPDSVTSIGGYTFYGCTGLASVTIGNGVTSIGYSAFRYCSSLTSITIPDSVTSIGYYAFYNCYSLTSITIPDSVTSIGKMAFYGCNRLTSITIPDGVTSIGEDAFGGCSSLMSITIPDSVTSIGGGAFNYCYKLIEVCNLSKLDITIGSYSNGMVGYYAKNVYTTTTGASKLWTNSDGYIFYEDGDTCYLMGHTGGDTVLTLPANCNGKDYAIYQYAFYNCSGLTSITIPNGVTSIGNSAFSVCSSLKSITIPDGVTSIGNSAFQYCGSLTSITIPDSVTSIGNDAFFGCYKLIEVCNLSELNITAGSKSNGYVGYYAKNVYTDTTGAPKLWANSAGYIFYEGGDTCYLMGHTGGDTALTLPANCDGKNYAIYQYAFYNCSNLTSITIPDSVTSIGSSAFGGCSSLMSITIPDSVTSIGKMAFYGCNSLTSITIPNSVTRIDWEAFGGCSSLTSITIPDSVTSMGGFSGCSSLTSITIPDGVTSIGEMAFLSCSSLTSITIPNSMTSIGKMAFCECYNLTSINFKGTRLQWSTISKDPNWNDYNAGNYTVHCTDGNISKGLDS